MARRSARFTPPRRDDVGARAAPDDITRRVFVSRLAFVGGGAVLLGGCKKDEPKPPPGRPPPKRPPVLTVSHQTFTDPEYQVLVAAVDRMLPKDDDPGAVEANVPAYIDAILQTEQLARMKRDFPPGLNALSRRCERLHKVPFDQATAAQQDEVLAIFKDSPEASGEARWYELLVVLTMEGFLGDPSYGGNKDRVGWALVGFKLVGSNAKGDPPKGYQGSKLLDQLRCGGGKGC